MIEMRAKSRLTLVVDTIIDFLIHWAIGGMFTYLLKRLAGTLKGKAHLGDYINYTFWKFIYRRYLPVYFRYFLSYKTVEKSKTASELRFFNTTVGMILRLHKDVHRNIVEIKACPYCEILRENKSFFQTYAPNPELYPPFKFSRSF